MKVVRGVDDVPQGLPHPVATIGNFDGMHLGHQKLMRGLAVRAHEIGGTATVITFDPHPLQVLAPGNAPRPIQTLSQKLRIMERLGIDLAVAIPFDRAFAALSPRQFVDSVLCERLSVREVYVGPNFAFGHRREGSLSTLRSLGETRGFSAEKIHQVHFRGSRVSSTAVRQALTGGQVTLARRLLGRPYEIEGRVVHGDGRGAGIGVRTANVSTPNELIPRRGVYVTLLNLEDEFRLSVTNIGLRPTITGGGETAVETIETHAIDFDGEIYGQDLRLEFLSRLRDERRFSGPAELLAQIRRDIARARRYHAHYRRVCSRAESTSAQQDRP